MTSSSSRTVSRRGFLKAAALVIVAAGVSVVGLLLMPLSRGTRGSQTIVDILHARFPYLRLDSDGSERFAKDFVARLTGSEQRDLASLARLLAVSGWTGFRLPGIARRIEEFGDKASSSFLLGSDFFRHDADESRVVRYLGYYDPYTTRCRNPMARFDS